eukprot:6551990-Alexandrium_andersonii.AAC.1
MDSRWTPLGRAFPSGRPHLPQCSPPGVGRALGEQQEPGALRIAHAQDHLMQLSHFLTRGSLLLG